jgi:hypothetical protein
MQPAGLASAKESALELVVVRADPRSRKSDAPDDSLSFIALPVTGCPSCNGSETRGMLAPSE